MTISRADRSVLAEWWFTIDRALLASFLVLAAVGVVLSFATSTTISVRRGLSPFQLAERHLLLALAGVTIMLVVTLLDARRIRRLALAGCVAGLLAMVWVLLAGPEVNGARRWLRVEGFSFQPSELAKPCFVVLSAWLLAESRRRPDVPAFAIAVGLLLAMTGLLVLQPDFGQTVLIVVIWGTLLLLSGRPLGAALGFGVAALASMALAASTLDHVASRLRRFIDPAAGGNYQLDRAIKSFSEGGLFGRGPGEGTIKSTLPDAHTDFIFAVIGEEYGALACLALLGLFAFIALRPLVGLRHEPDAFLRLAISGLALLIGLQAGINMGVNVGLLPTKGMTLPFVSAGGSSTLAVGVGAGMLLALVRSRAPVRSWRTVREA